MRTHPRAAVAAALVLAAGCKGKPTCASVDDPAGVDLLTIQRLQAATKEGPDPCPELAAPTIVVDGRGLSHDGALLAKPSELPTTSLTRVDVLFKRLKDRRELWKQIHPGADFAARPTVRIAADAEAFAGASVLATVAFAGLPTMHVECGDVAFDFEYAVPPPLDSEDRRDVAHFAPQGTFHDTARLMAAELAKPTAPKRRHVLGFQTK